MRQLWYTKAPIGYWIHFEDSFKSWHFTRPDGLFSYDEILKLRKLKHGMEEDEKYRSLFA